jgi:hypothetical protein
MKRIIELGLPAPLTLVPHLLKVVGEWHLNECPDVNLGCRVWLTFSGMLVHGQLGTNPSPKPPETVM